MRQQVALHGKDNRIGGVDPIPPGRWEYAGTATPLLNGYTGPFRWRRTNENQTEIQGSVTGGTANPVINLPDPYRPPDTQYVVNANSDNELLIWKFEPNGDLSVNASSPTLTVADLDAVGGLHWGLNTDTNGDGLTLAAEANVNITTDGFDFGIDAAVGGDVEIATSGIGGMELRTEDGNIQIHTNGNGQISLTAPAMTLEATDTGNVIALALPSTGSLCIYDNGAGQIMRLDEDGTLHLLSGASIVYDL